MVDLKIGVVGIPDKWSTETLADAVAEKTGFRQIIDMGKVNLDLTKNHLFYKDLMLCDLDALIIKKITTHYSPDTLDRLELLRVVECAGVQVFSSVERIQRLINRLSCTVTLRNADIPMPETCITENISAAIEAVQDFGSAVFKPLYSSKAQGMFVIDAKLGTYKIEKQIRQFQKTNPMLYIQKKLELPGRDLGLVFLGGQYLGTYARVSKNDSWNTTINSGGRYAKYNPSDSIIELAYKAQSLFNMDFTTVDIAETENGPVVFEVSAFGGFRGALEGIGINAAEMYVNHVLEKLST